jgi:AP-1 complex subunit mu
MTIVLDIEEEGQQVTPCFTDTRTSTVRQFQSAPSSAERGAQARSIITRWDDGLTLCTQAVLALSRRNTNVAEVIIFLHRFVQVLVEYFKELEEESIRDNFVIIYELMDEMMDYGYPQTTESKILQE